VVGYNRIEVTASDLLSAFLAVDKGVTPPARARRENPIVNFAK